MKRHPVLIPISREHHEILLLAQLLKLDAPAYKGLPTKFSEKLIYAEGEFERFIQAHLLRDQHHIFPFLDNWEALKILIADLKKENESILATFQQISALNESEANDLGLRLTAYVRMKERQLFESAQQQLAEKDFEALSRIL